MWEAFHAAGMKYETEVVCGTGKCFVHGVNEGDWEKKSGEFVNAMEGGCVGTSERRAPRT